MAWFLSLLVGASVITVTLGASCGKFCDCKPNYYYNYYDPICSVGSCISLHFTKYDYQPMKDMKCCKRPLSRPEMPDINCCISKTNSGQGVCNCYPYSQCYKNAHPPTTLKPTTPKPTTPKPTTPKPTTPKATTPKPTTPKPITPEPIAPTLGPEPTEPIVGFSYCGSLSDFRILNGVPVQNECAFEGISRITLPEPKTGQDIRCHALYTTAMFNNKRERTFSTSNKCITLINTAIDFDLQTSIQIGTKTYPLSKDLFEFVPGSNGVSFLKPIDTYTSIFDNFGSCQKGACAYDPANVILPPITDLVECKIASYGVTDGLTNARSGLNAADIELTPSKCEGQDPKNLCFTAKSGLSTICGNLDEAALVYCTSAVNNEVLFIGHAKSKLCESKNPAFEVHAFPGKSSEGN